MYVYTCVCVVSFCLVVAEPLVVVAQADAALGTHDKVYFYTCEHASMIFLLLSPWSHKQRLLS